MVQLSHRATELAARLRQRDRDLLAQLVARVRVRAERLDVDCSSAELGNLLGLRAPLDPSQHLSVSSAVAVKRSGRAVRLIYASGAGIEGSPSPSVLQLLIRARRW